MARFIPTNRDQLMMLPLSLEQFVDGEHLARRIWSVLSLLELKVFEDTYKNAERGALAIHPKHLIAVLVYAYARGVRSSREIEKHCKEDLAYMYLSEMQTPDHTTISNFRTAHGEELEELFTEVVFVGVESGLIDFKHIASDGTKIDGSGSKSQIVYAHKIEAKIEKCKVYARQLLDEAKKADDEDNKKKLDRKKKELDMRLNKLYKAKAEYDKCKTRVTKDDKKLRYHLTEPEARLMKDKDGFHSGYNCQVSVDSKTQMILDKRVTQKENDSGEGGITRERLINRYGNDRLEGSVLSFDNGYHNQKFIALDGKDGIELLVSQSRESQQVSSEKASPMEFHYDRERDSFICPANKELTFYRERVLDSKTLREYRVTTCSCCHLKDQCFKKGKKNQRQKSKLIEKSNLRNSDFCIAYQKKMDNDLVKKEYRKRIATVEPVFAHMTEHRRANRFRVWGLIKAECEFTWMCLVHNFLKIIKYSKLDLVQRLA